MRHAAYQLRTVLRYLLPCLILGWLAYQLWTDDRESIAQLARNADRWPRYFLAMCVYLIAITVSFLRWWCLVVALRLPFNPGDAIRLGFMGYVLQYVSLGSLGGDVFKAYLIARQQPERKPEAAATVLVDRVVGLFSLTLLALLSIGLWRDVPLGPYEIARPVCMALAAAGIVAFVTVMFMPWSLMSLAKLRLMRPLRAVLIRVQAALDMYRAHHRSVLAGVGLGMTTHFLQALAIYLAATAFFPHGPGLRSQIFMWAVAGIVAAIPIVPGGLGTFDIAYKTLYENISPSSTLPNEGFLVALLFRGMCLVAVVVGVLMYWIARRQLADPGATLSSPNAATSTQPGCDSTDVLHRT